MLPFSPYKRTMFYKKEMRLRGNKSQTNFLSQNPLKCFQTTLISQEKKEEISFPSFYI